MTHIISWNVNGIRANLKKLAPNGKPYIQNLVDTEQPDFLCLQEVRSTGKELDLFRPTYPHIFTHVADKKGYSGTAILAKEAPIHVYKNFSAEPAIEVAASHLAAMSEGRVLTAEYPTYFIVTTYTPNAKAGLERLEERQVWDGFWCAYLKSLAARKPVIACGDLNVAHTDQDVYAAKGKAVAGVTAQERAGFSTLLNSGFVDTFRAKHPDVRRWSWWSNFAQCRARNVGWRIDYVLVSSSLQEHITVADCLNDYLGSDHCPVALQLSAL